jgi:hypothetical protein
MAQRIHIRPQRHDRPRLTAIQQRNNAGGAADVALNLKPAASNASPMYADVLCSSKPSSGI